MDEKRSQSRLPFPRWALVLVAILSVICVLQLWLNGRFSGLENIPLTDVTQMIVNGEVETIKVSGNQLTVTRGDGTGESSVKEEGSLIEQFRNLGVSAEALSTTDIEFEDASTWNSILTIIISLGPVLLLIWVINRGFKRLQGGGNRISNIARSNAHNGSSVDRLRELKSSYEEELITEQEYETKKAEILSEL